MRFPILKRPIRGIWFGESGGDGVHTDDVVEHWYDC
jgi:hypothetical protein